MDVATQGRERGKEGRRGRGGSEKGGINKDLKSVMSGILKPPGLLRGQEMPDDLYVFVQRLNDMTAALYGNLTPQTNLELPSQKRAEEQINEAVRSMVQIFPDLCPKFASAALKFLTLSSKSVEEALQQTVDQFLQSGYPKSRRNVDGASTSNAAASTAANGREHQQRGVEIVDLDSSDDGDIDSEEAEGEIDSEEAELYEAWCVYRLSLDFPRIGLPSLKMALKLFQGKLDPTYKAVNLQYQLIAKKKGLQTSDAVIEADQGLRDTSWLPRGKLKLLKAHRPPKRKPSIKCPRFEREYKAVQLEFQKLEEYEDLSGNDGGGPIPPTGIECGCCYAENLFEELVQCADGHLFCTNCLRRHLEGYIFGGSQACGLPKCLDTNGCDKTFPWSEVKRALPLDVLSKYEQRQAEDAVARAKLEGLVYCPFCNHPWEVDHGMAVLRCHNEGCKKASCIKCKEPDHLPLRCEEVEKKSETSMRRKVEEHMTRALIRECTSCKAELVKLEGCNKVTCRCGQSMCYVCRKPITTYSHFCQHVREPNLPCKLCGGCSLWERENEAAVVEAAKKAAIEEVGAQEPVLLKRAIGPSEVEKPRKKPRLVHVAYF